MCIRDTRGWEYELELTEDGYNSSGVARGYNSSGVAMG